MEAEFAIRLTCLLGGETAKVQFQVDYSYGPGDAGPQDWPVLMVPPRRVGPSGTSVQSMAKSFSGEAQSWLNTQAPESVTAAFVVTFGWLPPGRPIPAPSRLVERALIR